MARGPMIGGAALASIAVGLGLGLLIAWVLWPVQFTNADPSDLRSSYKDDYIRMISAAYETDGNLTAAKQRLARLGIVSPEQSLRDLIAHGQQASSNSLQQQSLLRLAQALALPRPTGTQPSPAPSLAGSADASARADAAFRLVEHAQLTCFDEPEEAHLRLYVRDAQGQDLANVPIQVSWTGGNDTVYTGLKPERGIGYADFQAEPGEYGVTIEDASSDSASDLIVGQAPADCSADRGATPRGWKLVFQQE